MKVKKILLLFIFLLVGSLTCLGKVQASTDTSLQHVKQKGTLVVGTSADYPPYEFTVKQNGQTKYVGLDIEIAKQFAKNLELS